MNLPKIVTFLPYPRDYWLEFLTRGVDESRFEFVLKPEPPREEAPGFLEMFSRLENVFITPHISSATREAMERSKDQISENVRRIIEGEKPLFVVNGL